MKYIVKYQEFESVNEELNWWQKLLIGGGIVGSMFTPKEVSGQTKDNGGKRVVVSHTKTGSEKSAERLQNKGWKLDKVQIDTLWREVQVSKPDTQLITSTLQFDDAQFFPSGKFVLTQVMMDSISQELQRIDSEGGVVTDVMIESSTDKQGLSKNLQNSLEGLGYKSNNEGLSHARCDAIKKYLLQQGVNSTIIQENPLWEKGEGKIDQSARYVFVRFAYIVVEENVTPGETELRPDIKKTYHLSKETSYKSKKVKKEFKRKFNWGHIEVKKHGPIKNRKLNLKGVECRMPGG